VRRIADGKHLIFEGLEAALDRGADPTVSGALVDEQFGGPSSVPEQARAKGVKLAMPVEKSGQDEFDFEYGDEFGSHIERYDPDFSKVLVRYNPDGDRQMNRRQAERLRRLSDWLHEHERKYLFELLVPAEDAQLASVAGDSNRYDAELRPELMCRAIGELQGEGVEPDVWKIEGVDTRADCERIAAQCRAGGRDGVACVVLGRGADDKKVDHWLRQGAPVDGYVGFAIGRSIWGDPLKGFIDGSLSREEASRRIADKYLGFIEVYASAEASVG
jgi:5-dehydro-2-deoxygluconokinase